MSDFDIEAIQDNLIASNSKLRERQFGQFDNSIEAKFSEILGASFRNDNLITSTFNKISFEQARNAVQIEQDFDYSDKVPADMLMFRDRFVTARSEDEMDMIANKIRREQSDKAILADNPWRSFGANILASGLDPTTFLPIGNAYKAGKGAVNAGKAIFGTAAATAGAVAIQEVGLRATQETRSLEESVYNTMGAAVFGSALRGVGVGFSKFRNRASAEVADVYKGNEPEPLIGNDGNLSAAAVDLQKLAENDKFVSGVADVIAKIPLNPLVRLYKSEFTTANSASELLFSQFLPKKKNQPEFGGVARETSVATNIATATGKMNKALLGYQNIFFEHADVSGVFPGVKAKMKGVSFEKWDNAVSEAIIAGGVHENPAVQKGAQHLMKNVFEPLRDEAIELKLLPKNVSVSTASAYFTRIYNVQKIREQPNAFKETIKPYFKEQNDLRISMDADIKELERLIKVTKTELTRARKSRDKQRLANAKEAMKAVKQVVDEHIPHSLKDSNGNIRKKMNSDEIEVAINRTVDNILNENTSKMNPITARLIGKAKPLNNRHFLIPDTMIREWTLGSGSGVANKYVQSMVPHIEFAKLGKDLGIESKQKTKQQRLADDIAKLEDDLDRGALTEAEEVAIKREIVDLERAIDELDEPPTINQVASFFEEEMKGELDRLRGNTDDPKRNAKLQKQYESARRDIKAGIDILAGRYGKGDNSGNAPSEFLRNMRMYNILIRMGGVALSSVTDVGILVMRHGPSALAKEGVLPIFKSNLAKTENKSLLQDLGFAMNQYNGRRLRSMMDFDDVVQSPSKVTQGLDKAVQGFMNLSGMNQWQDAMQFMAGNMSISRTLRSIDNWVKTGVMDKNEAVRLNALGLGQAHWSTIHEQWKKHGGIDEGAYYAKWDNFDISTPEQRSAYDKFKAALYDDITSTIVEPGAGDLPLFARTDQGKLLLQFKTFFIATHNKLLLSGLNQGDANFYMGLVSMMALGQGVYLAKELIRGNDDIDLSPTRLAQEGFDRAGFFGVFQEGFGLGQRMLVGPNGAPSRYAIRGVWSTLLGPSAGTIEDMLLYGASPLMEGEFDRGDAEKLKRLLPYMNLFYIDHLTKRIAGDVAVALGAEETE